METSVVLEKNKCNQQPISNFQPGHRALARVMVLKNKHQGGHPTLGNLSNNVRVKRHLPLLPPALVS